MTNLSDIQNIAYKLNQLDQEIDDTMLMTKIMSVLPEEYKHFSSAWDSTVAQDIGKSLCKTTSRGSEDQLHSRRR
jgi:hypothetical protein